MTNTANDIYATAFKNATVTLLARIVGNDCANVRRADIASLTYSVYLLDDDDADARNAVTGHAAAALTPADVLFDVLQTDALWTADDAGYNFRHLLDVSAHAAFPTAGRRYLVEYRLTPAAGQVIVVRFRVNVV
jgi:hypothetical protein